MTKQIFAVVVTRDDSVKVVAEDVVKETPQLYFIDSRNRDDVPWHERRAFGYSQRIWKTAAFTSARSALEHYMSTRQLHKENALAVVAQATKQIASANEQLMHLPAADDPGVERGIPSRSEEIVRIVGADTGRQA